MITDSQHYLVSGHVGTVKYPDLINFYIDSSKHQLHNEN